MTNDWTPPVAGSFPVILSGPSGAGKSTISREMLLKPAGLNLRFSVSVTTREPRPSEVDGVHYRFIRPNKFRALVRDDLMLEYATVHGDLYGTPRSELANAKKAGAHLLMDIDVHGARTVRAAVPGALSIFLIPPSTERILKQLRGRGSESAVQLRRRFKSASSELRAVPEFDYLVVNDTVESTARMVLDLIRAERRSTRRLTNLKAFTGMLASDLELEKVPDLA